MNIITALVEPETVKFTHTQRVRHTSSSFKSYRSAIALPLYPQHVGHVTDENIQICKWNGIWWLFQKVQYMFVVSDPGEWVKTQNLEGAGSVCWSEMKQYSREKGVHTSTFLLHWSPRCVILNTFCNGAIILQLQRNSKFKAYDWRRIILCQPQWSVSSWGFFSIILSKSQRLLHTYTSRIYCERAWSCQWSPGTLVWGRRWTDSCLMLPGLKTRSKLFFLF